MYLWKYWRETRIAFCVALIGIAILFLLIFKEPNLVISGNPPFDQFARLLSVAVFIQALPVGFFAWFFGSVGVGRDQGDGSGSFLFTRPRSRAFFVWRDWGFGLLLLLALVILVNVALGFQFHRVMVAAGDPLHGRLPLASGPASLAFLIGLDCVVVFLFAALVFSLTYFSTVVMKHSKGVMLAAGVLLGYMILKALVSHYWPSVDLPPLIAADFFGPGSRLPALANHLGAFLAARAAFILLFPIAAQLVLEKADL
jgi:hypothetical protein